MNNSILDNHKIVEGTLTDQELLQLEKLFKLVWPDSGFTLSYLEWLYKENPNGNAYTYNVTDNCRILAHYAAIPVQAMLFGKKEKGLLSLNTVVDPECRGKGYFKALATSVYGKAKTQEYGFVIGVANATSTLLFQRLLRFQLVGPLSVKFGIGKICRRDPVYGQLDYKSFWDKNTLSWRLGRPGNRYQWQTTCTQKRNLLIDTGRFGVHAFVNQLDLNSSAINLKRHFIWNPIKIWIGLDSACDWKRSLYFDLPSSLKPSPLNLVFKDLTGMNRKINPENILFTLLDFDAF